MLIRIYFLLAMIIITIILNICSWQTFSGIRVDVEELSRIFICSLLDVMFYSQGYLYMGFGKIVELAAHGY